MIKEATHLPTQAELDANPQLPLFTLVFDREDYDASLFKELWKKHRIAVIAYRKNVRDPWQEKEFKSLGTKVIERDITMKICERKTRIGEVGVREVGRLSDSRHQTSIITTNRLIDTATVAGKMFSRWSQENFFKYALQDFDLDGMAQYGVEEINQELKVVNPLYRKTMCHLKKANNEIRMLVKEIILSDADLLPDYEQKTLKVRIHSLSTPRANKAVSKLCPLLN